MEYNLEDCSTYEIKNIGGKKIVIFDDHNMALPVWGTISSELGTPLDLVTFDFHTDTHAPFAVEICKAHQDMMTSAWMRRPRIREILKGVHYKKNNFSFEEVWSISVSYLRNDEHIQTAYEFDYINSYSIVCDLDSMGARKFTEDDRGYGFNASYYGRCEINKLALREYDYPIILDIDLDFFVSEKSFSKQFINVIVPLIQKAEIITIAREPDWFERCKEQADFSNDDALSALLEIIKEALK